MTLMTRSAVKGGGGGVSVYRDSRRAGGVQFGLVGESRAAVAMYESLSGSPGGGR